MTSFESPNSEACPYGEIPLRTLITETKILITSADPIWRGTDNYYWCNCRLLCGIEIGQDVEVVKMGRKGQNVYKFKTRKWVGEEGCR